MMALPLAKIVNRNDKNVISNISPIIPHLIALAQTRGHYRFPQVARQLKLEGVDQARRKSGVFPGAGNYARLPPGNSVAA